jgi:hypothetical protein
MAPIVRRQSSPRALEVAAVEKAQLAAEARSESGSRAVSAKETPKVEADDSVDVSFDGPMAAKAAPPQLLATSLTRDWRVLSILGAVALALFFGIWVVRSKRIHNAADSSQAPAKLEPNSGVRTGQVVTEPVVPNAPVAATQAPVSSIQGASTASAAGAGIATPQTGSFADAFVKHAAAANSSWAEVKKRPKSAEPAQVNHPAATAKAGSNDSPLDLLDKLEKARKSKKQAPGKSE